MDEIPFHIRFLREELEERKSRNPAYSLRAFARALSMDPSDLSKLMSGKKPLSLKGAAILIRKLEVDSGKAQALLYSTMKHQLRDL